MRETHRILAPYYDSNWSTEHIEVSRARFRSLSLSRVLHVDWHPPCQCHVVKNEFSCARAAADPPEWSEIEKVLCIYVLIIDFCVDIRTFHTFWLCSVSKYTDYIFVYCVDARECKKRFFSSSLSPAFTRYTRILFVKSDSTEDKESV